MGASSSSEAQPAPSDTKPSTESSSLLSDAVNTENRTIFGGWISWQSIKKHGDVIFAVVFFMICSSSMLLVNKVIMTIWDLPVTVTLIQLVFACIAIALFPSSLRIGSRRDAWRWLRLVPLLFAIMLATSMLALRYSTTGSVVVTRNVAPFFALAVEALAKEKVQVDVWTVLALLYTLGGVVLYMLNDVQFSAIGLLFMVINMVSAVGERVVERRRASPATTPLPPGPALPHHNRSP